MTRTDPQDPNTLLDAELRWLIRLRAAAGATMILGMAANAAWVGFSDAHARVLVVGLVVLLYNALLYGAFRRRVSWTRRREGLIFLAWSQILADLVCLTLVTLWTGGIGSPLLGLFVLHLVFASLLLPPLASYLTAIVAFVLMLTGLRLTGAWPQDRPELLVILGWVLLLLLMAFLTDHVTRNLRDRETELRRQHRRTRAIVETAAEGIITIDDAGIITSLNPAAERIFGYESAELIGLNISVLMPAPADREHLDYIGRYIHTGEANIIGRGREVVGRHRDGRTLPLDLAVSEVRLGDRRIFTGIVRDITERKRAEEAMNALNEELRRQQQALVQHEKMAAMGQMAAGVAHEISNPLASMDSLLQLIERQPDRMSPDTIQTLREQVARVGRIVRQMTEFAHPGETGWETVSLAAVVEGALEMLRFDHRLREIEVVRDLSTADCQVRLMPHAVQQVIVNLVLNALDALEGLRAPRLTLRARCDGTCCCFEVTDNGHGIPPEDVGRIFEPFFTTKPVGRGTGLGLSISYSIVEHHGGRFEVRSAPEGGTTFEVCLPATGPPSRDGEDEKTGDS